MLVNLILFSILLQNERFSKKFVSMFIVKYVRKMGGRSIEYNCWYSIN